MFSFVKKLFGPSKKQYEKQKKFLLTGTPEQRRQVAENTGTHPEALYYLAKDEDAAVRQAVAVNKSTPVHASTLLANDKSPDVRLALAARLVELLPDLSAEKHSQLYAYAVQALGVLAQDEVVKIRQSLSTALKDHAKAPPRVVKRLAKDVEREVAEPVLRFCLALSDEDLLEILADLPAGWAIGAIASRPAVSPRVAEAVIDTNDAEAGKALVANKGAQFTPELLYKIIEKSRDYPTWHEDIAVRRELSLDLAQRFAGFVNQAVLDVMEKRQDFDPATRAEIASIVKRRVAFGSPGQETSEAKLERYIKAGHLSPGVIMDALAWNDHKFAMLALAHLSKIHPIVVEKMLRSGSGKPIIALCWKAGMPIRVATELQHSYAKLSPKEIIYAKGGTDYPMTAPEIKWQLDFYGVDVTR